MDLTAQNDSVNHSDRQAGADSRTVISEMRGVREYCEEAPVTLIYDRRIGRVLVRAVNECGHNETLIDFVDLIRWMSEGRTARMDGVRGDDFPGN
jgi:hypothetical protein